MIALQAEAARALTHAVPNPAYEALRTPQSDPYWMPKTVRALRSEIAAALGIEAGE